MRLTRRSSSMSKSLSVGTPGLEATASRSRARSSVVMHAEASALCIALRRVGDDLAVVRFEAPAVLASQALTSPCSGHSTHAKRLVGQSCSQDVSAACGRAEHSPD
jgi:hypothetical protein